MSAQVGTTAATIVDNPTVKTKAKVQPISPAPYLHEDLVLVRTTVPEIIHRTWTNNMEEWAKGVPLSQYHAREKHLASTAFSSNNHLVTWILVPKLNADVTDAYKQWVLNTSSSAKSQETRAVSGGFDPLDISEENMERILGALETYERPGIVATVGDEELKDVSSMSVASVYAPSKYRNHGYGKLMMKLLWEEIERIGASFTFLYSDLGAQFYTNFGWTARKSTEIVIPPSLEIPIIAPSTVTENPSNSNSSSEPHKPMTRASVKQVSLETVTHNSDGNHGQSILQTLVDRDAQLLRQSLKQMIHPHQQGDSTTTMTTFVAVTPEIRCFQWLHARAWFNALEIYKFKEPVVSKDLNYGVRVAGRDDQFILWHHDFTDDNLFILRWRIESEELVSDNNLLPLEQHHHHHYSHDTIALTFIKAAQQEAKKWNLSKIVYWNGDASLAKLLGLKVNQRNHSIPSLGLVNSKQDTQSVEWILNEKYSW
ncbi:hypothetical protein BGX27_004316 [Mortierella sp. AM989]|nr:hypothetical protein BGX27_004316 [Mortierella sp. AM989]